MAATMSAASAFAKPTRSRAYRSSAPLDPTTTVSAPTLHSGRGYSATRRGTMPVPANDLMSSRPSPDTTRSVRRWQAPVRSGSSFVLAHVDGLAVFDGDRLRIEHFTGLRIDQL